MSLTKVTFSMISGACVNVKDFGAVCDGTTDDTVAIQAAIDYAIANNFESVEVPGMSRITQSIKIDRPITNYPLPDSGKFFTIQSNNGGGFFYDTADGTNFNFISTRITQSGSDPVCQFVEFNGITFEVDQGGPSDGSYGLYVMDGNKFLRIRYHNCDFLKVKYVSVSGGKYIQTHYFDHCNIRDWAGDWFKSLVWNFDVKITTCMIEKNYGGSFVVMKSPQACSIANNLIEAIQGTSIVLYSIKSITISGNYFEGNGNDIDMESSDPNYGVTLISNSFSKSVNWGSQTIGCVSIGNEKVNAGTLHTAVTNADVIIKDSARTGTVTDRYVPAVGNPTIINGPVVKEGFAKSIDPSGTQTLGFQLENGSTYLLTIRVNNGANAVTSNGMFMVARQGTGTLVTEVAAVNYFTVTVNGSYQIVITNTDASQRNCSVTVLRVQ